MKRTVVDNRGSTLFSKILFFDSSIIKIHLRTSKVHIIEQLKQKQSF